MKSRRVGILIFPDVEVLDFCGPFEVFAATRLNEERRRQEPSPFEVVLVAEQKGLVTASGGLRVAADHDLDECPALDILVVAGGWGTRRQSENKRLLSWIAERGRGVEWLASVCTGARLLAGAGMLDGHRATTHQNSLAHMRALWPKVDMQDGARVVFDGQIVTSAGISAGIDMALQLVDRCCGVEVARATANYMEYPFG
jgi:transcriptional regulator GlxA family with amidase domain